MICRAAAVLVLACLGTGAAAADYRIDRSRSHADFSVRLFWIHTITGRFDDIRGQVALEPRRNTASATATVVVDSLRMVSPRRRRDVLGPAFFDAARWPDMRFVSEPFPLHIVQSGGPLPGQLSLSGVARPVVFQLLPSPCPMDARQPCRLQLRGRVRRSAFGMTGDAVALSDHVRFSMLIALDVTHQ